MGTLRTSGPDPELPLTNSGDVMQPSAAVFANGLTMDIEIPNSAPPRKATANLCRFAIRNLTALPYLNYFEFLEPSKRRCTVPKDLLQLHMHTLEKARKNSEDVTAGRIKRLETYATTNDIVQSVVNKAIALTRSSHATAEKYHALENEVLQLATANKAEKLERVIRNFDRGVATIASSAAVNEINAKADGFMRKITSGEYSNSERLLTDELEYHFPDDPDLDRIKIRVALLYMGLKEQHSISETAATAVELSRLWRGMLYAGFIGHYGGELDREERIDAIRDLVIEGVTMFIPGASLAAKLIPIYRSWFDLESPSPSAEATNKVVNYLEGYTRVMELWNSSTPPSADLMQTCKQILSSGETAPAHD